LKEEVSMKRIILSVLAFAFVFGYGMVNSLAEERVTKSGEMSDVSKLIGMQVKTPQGEDIGIIADVLEGPQRLISFALFDYEVSDDTQMRIAVPFATLSCREQSCILNVSRENLNSAPSLLGRVI
jgi:hypothetical protein